MDKDSNGFVPVEDNVISKRLVIAQLEYMERCRRSLLAQSVGTNNGIAAGYDAGYLACLGELRDIINNNMLDMPENPTDEEEDVEF